MKYLRNERGNVIIFSLGIMAILLFMFLLIGSFASVFVAKEKSSNIAQQASLVASSILKEEVEEGIDRYELFVGSQEFVSEAGVGMDLCDFQDSTVIQISENIKIYCSLESLVDKRYVTSSSYNHLSAKEKKRQVTNDVLKEQIPINEVLQGYIEDSASQASGRIPGAVEANILENKGIVEGTEIAVSDTNRITISTNTRYEALKYDEMFSENERKVEQQGAGPTFQFLGVLSSKGSLFYTFPKN